MTARSCTAARLIQQADEYDQLAACFARAGEAKRAATLGLIADTLRNMGRNIGGLIDADTSRK